MRKTYLSERRELDVGSVWEVTALRAATPVPMAMLGRRSLENRRRLNRDNVIRIQTKRTKKDDVSRRDVVQLAETKGQNQMRKVGRCCPDELRFVSG